MTDIERKILLNHAQSVNDSIAKTIKRNRTAYLVLTCISALVGIVLIIIGQFVFGLCSLGLMIAFGLLLIDAHGHLQEVQRRPIGMLAPDFSVFSNSDR